MSFNKDELSTADTIGPSLNVIGNCENILNALKDISRIVKDRGILFMDLDVTLTEVKASKSDPDYYFHPILSINYLLTRLQPHL